MLKTAGKVTKISLVSYQNRFGQFNPTEGMMVFQLNNICLCAMSKSYCEFVEKAYYNKRNLYVMFKKEVAQYRSQFSIFDENGKGLSAFPVTNLCVQDDQIQVSTVQKLLKKPQKQQVTGSQLFTKNQNQNASVPKYQ